MDLKDACKKLQKEGLKFELYCAGSWVFNTWDFTAKIEDYRIAAQPIPDREDWREWCRKLQDCGVEFEFNWDGWEKRQWIFKDNIDQYRIPEQPIPEWKEEMIEETKPDPREEIPHRELQIQWHEDKLHSLRTREPMREWEYKEEYSEGVWLSLNEYGCYPEWHKENEYRRKPRTVTYWHCIVDWHSRAENKDVVDYLCSTDNKSEVKKAQESILLEDPTAKFSPIIETTVELED